MPGRAVAAAALRPAARGRCAPRQPPEGGSGAGRSPRGTEVLLGCSAPGLRGRGAPSRLRSVPGRGLVPAPGHSGQGKPGEGVWALPRAQGAGYRQVDQGEPPVIAGFSYRRFLLQVEINRT